MAASPPRGHIGAAPGAVASRVPTVGVLLIIGFRLFRHPGWKVQPRSWSVIYLRDEFSAAAWVATLTLPA